MASESTAITRDSAAAFKTEPPTSDVSVRSERRVPTARETAATLPEIEAGYALEPHDTIPAPPWHDEDTSLPIDAP